MRKPQSPSARDLLRTLARPHRTRILLLTALAVAQAALLAAPPWLVAIAIDHGVPAARQSHYGLLLAVGAAVAASAIASTWLTRRWQMLAGEIGQLVIFDLRTSLFTKLQDMHIGFHEKMSAGQIIARLTSDTESVNKLFGTTLASLLQAFLTIIVTTIAMLLLDLQLALVVFATLIPLGILTTWCVKRLGIAFQQNRAAIADTTVQLVESLNGIRTVQAFRAEERNITFFGSILERLLSSGREIQIIRGIYWPAVELMFSGSAIIVLLAGGFRVSDGALEVGVLAAFVLYVSQFFQPMLGMTASLDALQQALTALGKIAEVFEAEPEVCDKDAPIGPAAPARGEIVFDDVEFQYPGSAHSLPGAPEIPPCNLRLVAGQTVAMLGTTGAGKSTFAKLIARFYDPTRGRILLDGNDLRDLPETYLRQVVVMLTQEGFLFAGTVADNIRISRPTATLSEVEAAAKAMGADDFIRALPDGYETNVRKRGARLSAGQRQMIAFARAFLADPMVLILDEATSSLDIPTERAMQAALRQLLKDRTSLIIAHRVSTVEIADRVLVLERGKIVEDGAPGELLAKNVGEFAALHRDGYGIAMDAEFPEKYIPGGMKHVAQ